jgi:antitoxin component YwqK of YwqJK toxin-antitoxin module
MKKLFPLLSVLFLISLGFGQKLYEVIETYENGNIKSITYHKKIRDRIEKVKEEGYFKNGQKKFEGNFKDVERDGLNTDWYENGQKKYERTFKDGKRDGLVTIWYENGQKKREINYKYGKEDGSVIEWYKNGQKSGEGTYINGKPDRLVTQWSENGQKESEVTYKDGEVISEKYWNEDGSVME